MSCACWVIATSRGPLADSILIEKSIGFIGLADAQANMEKFLIQLIQKGVAEDKIKELFPYLTESIDYDLIKSVQLSPPLIPEALQWLDRLPRFNASNNWAVSGQPHRFRASNPVRRSPPGGQSLAGDLAGNCSCTYLITV